MVGNARGLRPVSDKNRLNRKHIEPVDLGKVNAIHPVEVSAKINERSVLGFFLSLFEGREGIGLQVRLRIEAAEARLNLVVQRFSLALVKVVELNCLLEREEVLFPVVALKGLGNLFRRAFYPHSLMRASFSRSRPPSRMARMILMPVTPVMSKAPYALGRSSPSRLSHVLDM